VNALRQFLFSKDGVVAVFALILTGVVMELNTENPLVNFAARLGNFCIFLYILWRAGGQKCADFFHSRRAGIAENLDSLAQQRIAAEKHLQALEKRIQSLDSECAAILSENLEQAELLRQAIIEKAHEDAVTIKEKAIRAAVAEAKTAMNDLRAATAEAILEAAQKALRERLDAKTHAKLIEEAVQKVVLQ